MKVSRRCKMSQGLVQQLRHYLEEEELIGFCPWADGRGMLWGYVKSVTSRSVTFLQVNSNGSIDETETYPLSSILYVEEDPTYAERLRHLAAYEAPEDAESRVLRARGAIYQALREAQETGEVIRVLFLDEQYYVTATCLSFDGATVRLRTYDDLMRPDRFYTLRKSYVKAIRRGESVCVCDSYLLLKNHAAAT